MSLGKTQYTRDDEGPFTMPNFEIRVFIKDEHTGQVHGGCIKFLTTFYLPVFSPFVKKIFDKSVAVSMTFLVTNYQLCN